MQFRTFLEHLKSNNHTTNHPTNCSVDLPTNQPSILPSNRPSFKPFSAQLMETMECFQFLLDLSGNTGIPSQWKIGNREVSKWLAIQSKGYKDIQCTNHYHKGGFSIQTGDRTTAEFLRTFVLEINWNGKTHRVPLKPAPTDKPLIWVRLNLTCKGIMAQLPNTYFDGILEEGGFTIHTPTQKRTYLHNNVLNGQRSARVDRGGNHLPRNHEWIGPEGHVFKWRLEYEGQPYYCFRGCDITHEDGKCPRWEKQQELKQNAGQQKCFFFSSSMLRLNQDTKMTRTDAIPGAKIGHVANHINNDPTIMRQAEVIAIQTGSNMDLGSVEISKPQVEHQANELVKVVKPLVEANKKVFIIDPVAGPIPDEAPCADHWAMVRQRMKKVAQKTKASWISLAQADWIPEEDIHEDRVHYSQSGSTKVMKIIGDQIKEETGFDVMAGMEIQEKPYAGIYRDHWKVGCWRCAGFHGNNPCPSIPEATESSDSDTSIIADRQNAHNISTADSWDLNDSDATPTNTSDETSSSSTAASNAIASYNQVVSNGSSILNEMKDTSARNRSASVTKRQREVEGNTTPEDTRRAKAPKDASKKGHASRKK